MKLIIWFVSKYWRVMAHCFWLFIYSSSSSLTPCYWVYGFKIKLLRTVLLYINRVLRSWTTRIQQNLKYHVTLSTVVISVPYSLVLFMDILCTSHETDVIIATVLRGLARTLKQAAESWFWVFIYQKGNSSLSFFRNSNSTYVLTSFIHIKERNLNIEKNVADLNTVLNSLQQFYLCMSWRSNLFICSILSVKFNIKLHCIQLRIIWELHSYIQLVFECLISIYCIYYEQKPK